ncbi:mediator of RNA polymerase II transcription subunit 26 [Nematostella vectensis]|uniref:mediator of RNA polymerase II transcription subunit 26 n=1 Tax=Nematostella vectensis TaxID=45351 RepID=UPI0013906E6B|nr:mediator of RNA polymerase II transcription subunit 26 [Nematostella vectensis]
MQDSPQAIKTRLDRAVDSEGNVLDMAAVLEIVTTLERLPITKEALETTRIGKTINLLRKKTNNESLAKRAKKLVKKWQSLVINHIQTTRSVDSPLNGSRISSPQINGAICETGTTSLSERTDKPRILEGKKRGLKRKRDGYGSDNSPIIFASQDCSQCNTPVPSICSAPQQASGPNSDTSTEDRQSPCENAAKVARVSPNELNKSKSEVALSVEPAVCEKLNKEETNNHTHDSNEFDANAGKSTIAVEPLEKKESSHTDKVQTSNIESNSGSSNSSADENAKKSCDMNHIENTLTNSKDVEIENMTNSKDVEIENKLSLSEPCPGNTCTDSNVKTADPKDSCVADACSDVPERETNLLQEEEDKVDDEAIESKEPVLDLDQEADGVNGRYSDDGVWYSWADTMPSNEGSLQILPYVLLE